MPSPILRSVSLRVYGPGSVKETQPIAGRRGNLYIDKKITVPSAVVLFNPAHAESTDRLVRGGEGLSDGNPMPGRLKSMGMAIKNPAVTMLRQSGPVSFDQSGRQPRTTEVQIVSPRVEALEVTAQWVNK